jgi:hypothetical protein
VRAINWGALDRVARARETSVSVCSEAVPPTSPAEFARFIAADAARSTVIRLVGIKPQ